MVFADTGGWIAMAVKRDLYHKRAATCYRKLSKDKVRLVTSNYVFAKALQFNALIQKAIEAGRLNLEWVTPAIHKEAWDIFENYADQDFSFVDCTSFVISKRVGVREVFGFDDHFKTMGLILKPAKTK